MDHLDQKVGFVSAGMETACLSCQQMAGWCLPWTPKPSKIKVWNPQYMGYNPLKMKVVGSHASHDLLFEFWLVVDGFYDPASFSMQRSSPEGRMGILIFRCIRSYHHLVRWLSRTTTTPMTPMTPMTPGVTSILAGVVSFFQYFI